MASEYTPNYNLDLYASDDKPNLRDQYNAAMGKIDTQLKANADGVTNVSASVVAATTAANEAKQIAQDAEETATQAQTTANAAAPKSHASNSSIYGLGTNSLYGHVQVIDSVSSDALGNSGYAASPRCINQKIAQQLAPTTYLSETDYSYPSPFTGHGHFEVTYNPITQLVIVEWDNVSIKYNSTSTGRVVVFTLPSNMWPKKSQFATVTYDETKNHSVTFEVGYDGNVQLILTGSSNAYNYGGNLHAELVYYAKVS